MIPQLRVRTEFTFRKAFGPVGRVAAALAEMGAPAAGIVDPGTWGHVRWAKALGKTSVVPLFGREATFHQPDGKKPAAWALAASAKGFYRFSSALERPGADPESLFSGFSRDLVRFAGSALTDPELFDYVDVNPASPLQQRAALRLAAHTGRPLAITSDNWYPRRADVRAFLAMGGREAVTPQWLLTEEELRAAMPLLSAAQFAAAVSGTHEAVARCCRALEKAPLINYPGDLTALAEEGRKYRLAAGHIQAWTDEYEARMQRELRVIAEKAFEAYFFVVSDLVRWAKTHMLVGPARGSSAGSLVCYLLRITEVDPLKHELLFERFIDVSRNDLPDIDIDFNDQKRDAVFKYLADKYGTDNVARIGNVNTWKPRSVMAEVCKRLAIPDHERFDVVNSLIEYSSGDSRYGKGLEDTLSNTEPGRRFAAKYPHAGVMFDLENHASHTGVHAAGVIVCNDAISEYCTVGADGVIQADKPDAEHLNLLKIDALGLRTLGVIEDSGVVTAEQLYSLDLADPEVFKIFNNSRYAGIFQFEGQAQRRVADQVDVHSFRQIDHVTALARPGPLGGGAAGHYIARARGDEEVEFRHPSMAAYLGRTLGVVLYQEQVMRIVRELGKFSWEDTSAIRKAMSGRKGKEYFDQKGALFKAGAAQDGIDEESAEVIWNEICTFGAWGMNASHTVSYGIISYWCAWLKRYHPLEYAAACLRSAKDDDQTVEILRDMDAEGIKYVAFDPELSDITWAVRDGRLVGGFTNIKGYGPAKSAKAIAQRAVGKLNVEKLLAKAEIKFSELYPLSTKYKDLYANPERYGCREGSVVRQATSFPVEGDVLWLCSVLRREIRDENETVRAARRGGQLKTGQTLFLDVFAADDTGVPVTLRVDRFNWDAMGAYAAENLREGDVLLVRGNRIPNFSMIKVKRWRCLNRPEAVEALRAAA